MRHNFSNIFTIQCLDQPASLCLCALAIQTAIRLKTEGKSSMHQELKLRRREQRENSQNSQRSENQSSQSSQRSLSQSSQSEHSAEDEEPSSVTQHGEIENKEPDLEIIDIIQVEERE